MEPQLLPPEVVTAARSAGGVIQSDPQEQRKQCENASVRVARSVISDLGQMFEHSERPSHNS